MSLFRRRELHFAGAAELIGRQTANRTTTHSINSDTALRNSAVWACLRLRADLVSTFPVDVYRKVNGVRVEVPAPAFFDTPGGPDVDWSEWCYSSQIDLDRLGNTVGLITAVDALGLPSRVELWAACDATALVRKGEFWGWRYRGVEYPRDQVWHEKQYTVPGLHVGLSPIAYAAWTLGEYSSIQAFALDWFGSGAIPSGTLKNTEKRVNPDDARAIKQQFKATVGSGDVFVHGSDWEYSLIKAEMETSNWLEAKNAGLVDVARFLGVPADLIDAALSGQSITYANMSQRNLQFLVMNLAPSLTRRERAFSRRLLAKPRFMKFNTAALLRMDPAAQSTMLVAQVAAKLRTNSEARALLDLPPLTPEQADEFAQLYPKPAAVPAATPPPGGTS